MRCVDCEYHREFPVTGNHWCQATKKHKRISEEDAYKDVPCNVGKVRKEQTMNDECEECRIYGDDYRWDDDEQGYVSCCDDCIFNGQGEYDDD